MNKVFGVKVGDKVTYRNYGEIREGRVLRLLGKDNLHVLRLSGPMQGSTAWLHQDSIESILPEED